MKDQFDCIILLPNNPEPWIIDWKDQFDTHRTSYRLHDFLTLTFNAEYHSDTTALKTMVHRYDYVILPISASSLSWGRITIASLNEFCPLPVVGITNNLRLFGIQDLINLGISNVVRAEYDLDETILRLFQAQRIHKTNKYSVPMIDLAMQNDTHPTDPRDYFHAAFDLDNIPPFSEFKQLFVSRFEQAYITTMLARYKGNVTRAALASKKHRRAFWELVRKHNINAKEFEDN